MSHPKRSKWIDLESPQQPASEVAREVLTARLATVADYLPLAAECSEEAVEYVHQLRVSSRRASAAVDAFVDCLPAERARRMKRWLKRIRRSANDARDDDVLLERLRELGDTSHRAFALLIERVAEHRRGAQKPIVAIYQKARRRRFDSLVQELASAAVWPDDGPEPTFAELAAQQIETIAGQFFAAASSDVETASGLHALRIVGKRLRYSMEIFAGAFDVAFRESLYPWVEQLQERLGALNDHATAQARYQRWIAVLPPSAAAADLAALISGEWTAFETARHKFLAWWSEDRVEELRAGLEAKNGEAPLC